MEQIKLKLKLNPPIFLFYPAGKVILNSAGECPGGETASCLATVPWRPETIWLSYGEDDFCVSTRSLTSISSLANEMNTINPLANPKGVKLLCELCQKPAFVQCTDCRVTYYW